MTVVVISNPRTARARKRHAGLRQALPPSADVHHHLTGDIQEAAAVLAKHDWRSEDVLVINGGDGTAQNLLTLLLRRHAPSDAPRIALLPGGSTNMSAFDINTERAYGRCVDRLRSVLAPASGDNSQRQPAIQERPLVRVSLPGNDQYGFFFGIGTIVQGIEFFHRRIHPGGGRHELGAGLAMLRTLWGIARHQPPFAEPLTLNLRARILVDAAASAAPSRAEPGEESVSSAVQRPEPDTWVRLPIRLCLITSLNRLFLGIRPYWSRADQPLSATLIEADAERFIRSMPKLLTGKPNATMTPRHGYHSVGLRSLPMQFDGPLTLDGELFTNEGDTITVDATHPLRFLNL